MGSPKKPAIGRFYRALNPLRSILLLGGLRMADRFARVQAVLPTIAPRA
jgi:hypothetical protein